jgi:hypothetical protein
MTSRSSDQCSQRFSGFVKFVLEESPNRAQLEAWFSKPKPEDIRQPLRYETPTYAQEPEELKRGNLLKSAEEYYERHEHRRRPSVWLVGLLTLIFFIPAFIVYSLSRFWHKVFPVGSS